MKRVIKFIILILIPVFSYSVQSNIFKEISNGESIIADYSVDNYFMSTITYFWKVRKNDKKLISVYSWKSLEFSFNNDSLEKFYQLFPYDGKRLIILSNGEVYIFLTQRENKKEKFSNFPYLREREGRAKEYKVIKEEYKKFKLTKEELDFIKKMLSDSEIELCKAYVSEISDDWDYDKPKDTYYYNNYMKLLKLDKYEYIEMEEKDEKEYYSKISERVFKEYNIKYIDLDFSKTKILINYLENFLK